MKYFMRFWSLWFGVQGLLFFMYFALFAENAPDERWHSRLLAAFVGFAVYTILDEVEKLKK